MRWKIPLAAIVILIAAYTVWPFYGLYSLASAVEARDPSALGNSVDFRRLRLSLIRQISTTHLTLTGRAAQLGPAAAGAASMIAHGVVGELITPEALMDWLDKGSGGPIRGADGAVPIVRAGLRNVLKTWVNSDYGVGTFYVALPPDSPRDQQFGMRLQLFNWRWKLAGIDMPEELRLRLAQEWLKRERQQ
jgi:hypothetical protein